MDAIEKMTAATAQFKKAVDEYIEHVHVTNISQLPISLRPKLTWVVRQYFARFARTQFIGRVATDDMEEFRKLIVHPLIAGPLNSDVMIAAITEEIDNIKGIYDRIEELLINLKDD